MNDKEFEVISSKIDKLTELFMSEIGGLKTRVISLEEIVSSIQPEMDLMKKEIIKLRKKQDWLGQEIFTKILRLERKIDDERQINEREHMTLMRVAEERYQQLEKEEKVIKEDINTLHALAKNNNEQHMEYDKILKVKRA